MGTVAESGLGRRQLGTRRRRLGARDSLVFFAPWRAAAAGAPLLLWGRRLSTRRRETALGNRSHAVSPVRPVFERRKMGKMRLVLPFQGPGPSRTGAFVWRNRPDCPYADLGIDAICRGLGEQPCKALGSALKTGSFVVSRACLRTVGTHQSSLLRKSSCGVSTKR